VEKLWEFARSAEGVKLVKYTLVSAISALTSIVLLAFIYGVLRLWTEVPSVLVADILAGIPSYFLNRQWVWGKSGRSHIWREVVPFFAVSITGIGFAIVTASLARSYANAHDLQHLARTVLVVGANIGAFALVWLAKYLFLNRLFREIADVELGIEA
jgi:putative flippase GtrA